MWNHDAKFNSIALITLLVVSAYFLFSCDKSEGPALGGTAPDFTLSDIGGNMVSLSEHRGKVVLVEFWATWCAPCRESIPSVNNIFEKYRDRGLMVLGISINRGVNVRSEVDAFIKAQHITYPVLLGAHHVEHISGVRSIPMGYLIDTDGVVVIRHVGFFPGFAGNLSVEIEKLL
jgi:cytochrome c biogenesis protein CcmG/thiol:disulfide interchange protein DsbE